MSEGLILRCPSKLNLTLEVLKKKDNGMHEIKSHFQLIDLCDVMHIEKSNAQQSSIRTNASIDIDSKKNLVYQAIEALSEHVSQELHCNIIIEKNIPIGGGLGGGSSDAAAALIGINKIFSLKLNVSELMKIGLKLGADVPFFVAGKNAIASGIGEQLSEINSETNKFLVISPPIHSSTQEMFQIWDELHEQNILQSAAEDENSFLQIFLQRHLEVKAIFKELVVDAPFKLSGTGSTIFCAVEDDKRIRKTLKKIPTKWRHFFCEPLQCSPLLKYLT
ncbi:4-(cytidine 5'-diphospho)-2-C-methyl-D-erythritol kinase [Pseudomonadota bacterium]|nr:4-(cytidine 5'-diphospho)-2-C-methyl-D-erythritol kinase [Pseudomonadota bacterium]